MTTFTRTTTNSGLFVPSRYQETIFQWVRRGSGHATVNAVAGAGKTRTLTEAAQIIRGKGLFAAFNKHIAEELAFRLRGTNMGAKTLHSIGMSAVAQYLEGGGHKVKVDENKYRTLLDQYVLMGHLRTGGKGEAQRAVEGAVRQLINLARCTCTNFADDDALLALCDHFGIDTEPYTEMVYEAVRALIDIGDRLAADTGVIDFTDMLWLVERWDLTPTDYVSPWLFLDEAQDVNEAQKRLARKCLALGGRLLAVGDPRQAIYGFAGADAYAFDSIARDFQAVSLDLSICYRCPTEHLALAREIVPSIEAAPGAPAGTILHITEDDLPALLQPGDLVLCRTTTPLIVQCLRLIGMGIPATVKGRDIGKQIADVVRAVAQQPGYSWAAFPEFLEYYEMSQRSKFVERPNAEAKIEALSDRCNAIFEIYAGTFGQGAMDARDLCQRIESLFSDNRSPITLSTVHRAKGLECHRVIILRPDLLPLAWPNQRAWEATQEMNLKYVALTRSQWVAGQPETSGVLIFVDFAGAPGSWRHAA